MKTIWIVGAGGHVGTALLDLIDKKKYEIFLTDKEEVDISDEEQVNLYMNMNRPDVVINCAGFTDFKKCEENVDEAYKVNALGVRNLAQAAESIQAKLIQISTDDVFGVMSDKPYNEFDEVNPGTVYGKSKYAGEQFLSRFMSRYVIIRSSWVYGLGYDYVNYVVDCIKNGEPVRTSSNVFSTPTSTKEVARIATQFIDEDHFGVYHAVCTGGAVSREEFAREIIKDLGKEGQVEVIVEDAKEPRFSVLDNMMLRISGLKEPGDWKATLKEYLDATGGDE